MSTSYSSSRGFTSGVESFYGQKPSYNQRPKLFWPSGSQFWLYKLHQVTRYHAGCRSFGQSQKLWVLHRCKLSIAAHAVHTIYITLSISVSYRLLNHKGKLSSIHDEQQAPYYVILITCQTSKHMMHSWMLSILCSLLTFKPLN